MKRHPTMSWLAALGLMVAAAAATAKGPGGDLPAPPKAPATGIPATGPAEKPNVARDKFLANNPGYADRVAQVYGASVPAAAASMVEAVGDKKLDADLASFLLSDLIHDFLEGYVDGGGRINRLRHAEIISNFDDGVKKAVGNGEAFKRFVAWRKKIDPKVPLQFLMHPAPALPLTLPDDLAKEGWRVIHLDDPEDTKDFHGPFDYPLVGVVVIEKRDLAMHAPTVTAKMELLVYRTLWQEKSAEEHRLKMEAAQKKAEADKKPVPEILGHTYELLVVISETGDEKGMKTIRKLAQAGLE